MTAEAAASETAPAETAPVSAEAVVLPCRELPPGALARLLAPWGLELVAVGDGEPIPYTFWGEPEAGIAGGRVFVRGDTPVHSALHEACHLICAGEARRDSIATDAGGDFAEEDAVCYLQIVLAGELPGVGRDRMLADMDAWGYTFRLGSARAWFEGDAEDARGWLVGRGLLGVPGDRPGRSPAASREGLAPIDAV